MIPSRIGLEMGIPYMSASFDISVFIPSTRPYKKLRAIVER